MRRRQSFPADPALAATYAAVALLNLGYGMVLPVIPLYAHDRGASVTLVGLMASVLAGGRLLAQPVGGYLADRRPAKAVAAAGIALYAPALFAMALFPRPVLFVLFRFLEGVAEGTALPALYLLVARHARPEARGSAFGGFTAAATVGLAAGPAVGGVLGGRIGLPLLFLLVAAIALASAIVVLFLPSRDPVPATGTSIGDARRSPRRFLAELARGLLPASLVSLTARCALAVVLTMVPLYLHDRLRLSPAAAGRFFTLNFLVFGLGQPLAGRLSDRLPPRADLSLSAGAMSLGFVGMALVHDAASFAALFGLEAFAASWTVNAARRWVSLRSPAGTIGRGFGLVGMLSDVGSLLGPLAAGMLYARGSTVPFVIVAMLGLATIPVSLWANGSGRSA